MNSSLQVLAVCLGIYICIAESSFKKPAMMWPPRPGKDEADLTRTQLQANSFNSENSGPPPGRRSVSRSIFKASKTKRELTVHPPRPGDVSTEGSGTQDHDTGRSAASNRLTGALQSQVQGANSFHNRGGPPPGRRSFARRNLLKRSYGQTAEED